MILQNRAITVSENDGLPLPKRYWAILATALGVGMSVIDGTIANVALPTIARDLGTSPSVTIWVLHRLSRSGLSTLTSWQSPFRFFPSLHWETFTVTGRFTYQEFYCSASRQPSAPLPIRSGC